jgi:uncharacterized protein (TIGR03437 family)
MHDARLYVVSPTQINYLIPPGVAPGLATITVRRNGQVVATETVRISTVAPGIFSAASSGSGVAAAVFLRIDADDPAPTGWSSTPASHRFRSIWVRKAPRFTSSCSRLARATSAVRSPSR